MADIDLGNINTVDLLQELTRRGGHLEALADAGLLCVKKAEDYNAGVVTRDSYFPHGLVSYSQMIHTKSQRLISLCGKTTTENFESARDTCLDLVNYAGFCADWLKRTKK
jgi:hypothetical protein